MAKYSVIIPTYNDTERTVKLVNTIKEIVPKSINAEIIIADNNPDLQSEFTNIDGVRVIHCIEPGSYNARNKAILEAKGDMLIFTDSDCIPEENWITNIDKVVNICGCDVIAGKTKIFKGSSTELAYLYERNIAFNFDNMRGNRVATTSNLIVKRSIMNDNLFNTISFSGGDVEWTSKYSLNEDIYYDERIVVFHPSRASISDILDKDERVYGGFLKRKNKFKLFFSNLLPPITQIKLTLNSNEKVSDKIKLLSVVLFLRYIRLYLHLKISLSGVYRR